MSYCEKCGTELKNGEFKCPNCGQNIAAKNLYKESVNLTKAYVGLAVDNLNKKVQEKKEINDTTKYEGNKIGVLPVARVEFFVFMILMLLCVAFCFLPTIKAHVIFSRGNYTIIDLLDTLKYYNHLVDHYSDDEDLLICTLLYVGSVLFASLNLLFVIIPFLRGEKINGASIFCTVFFEFLSVGLFVGTWYILDDELAGYYDGHFLFSTWAYIYFGVAAAFIVSVIVFAYRYEKGYDNLLQNKEFAETQNVVFDDSKNIVNDNSHTENKNNISKVDPFDNNKDNVASEVSQNVINDDIDRDVFDKNNLLIRKCQEKVKPLSLSQLDKLIKKLEDDESEKSKIILSVCIERKSELLDNEINDILSIIDD